ncbi:cytochrome bd oxidase small subunit CydS [Paenibacillus aurantius]
MEHFLIMIAPPLIVVFSIAVLFFLTGRRKSDNGSR